MYYYVEGLSGGALVTRTEAPVVIEVVRVIVLETVGIVVIIVIIVIIVIRAPY